MHGNVTESDQDAQELDRERAEYMAALETVHRLAPKFEGNRRWVKMWDCVEQQDGESIGAEE